MATIDIDTSAVTRASDQVQTLRSLLGETRASLRSTASRMDWHFEGADVYRSRLDSLASRLDAAAELLDRHRGFLAHVAARFDSSEQSVIDAVPSSSASNVSLPGIIEEFAGGVEAWHVSEEPNAVAVGWADVVDELLVELYGGDTKVADVAGGLIDLGLDGICPYIGWAFAIDEILVEVGQGDYVQAIWEAKAFVPGWSAVEFSVDVAELYGQQLAEVAPPPQWLLDATEWIPEDFEVIPDENFSQYFNEGVAAVGEFFGF